MTGRQITALTVQQRNQQRVNVFLDGEFAFGLYRITAAWLHVGQTLTEEKIAELQKADGYEIALQQAARFIEFRPRTEAEVRTRLEKDEISPEIIDEVLNRLRAGGLVNDAQLAQAWVENRSAFRPRSRRALQVEMRRKGFDAQVIETALEDVDETQEENLAYQAAQKQIRKLNLLDRNEFRNKLGSFLARRGFGYEIIRLVTERLWKELEETNANRYE